MRHITVEELIDYTDGIGSETRHSAIATHLTECNHCTELKQELQALVVRLQKDASFEPPAELVNWSINLFQTVMRPAESSLRKFIASLIFDTFDQPQLAGVRRVGTPP